MAPVTVKNKVGPLTWNVPITNSDGTPTYEFQRKWLAQAAANAAVVDLSTSAKVSAVLDLIGSGKGSILYRGTLQWNTLSGAAGHDGWVLTWNDTTGLAEWRAVATGGGAASSFYLDGTDGYVALVDSNGQLVLDSLGRGVYSKDPVLPAAMLPLGSAAAFGALKVDGFSIAAAAGVIGSQFQGFVAQRASNQAVTDSTYTKVTYSSFVTNTLGTQLALATGLFTPTKAGNYLVFGSLLGQVATLAQQCNTLICKNGTFGSGGVIVATGSVPGLASSALTGTALAMAIVSMNGTTDTLEINGYVAGTGGSDVLFGGAIFFGAIYLGS